MKIDDTFTFKLESPDGDAVIVCTELPLDIRHELSAILRLGKDALSAEVVERYQTAMCESVVSVEGLSDSKPITGERVRARKISARTLDLITTGYWAAFTAQNAIDEKKRDSTAG